MSIRFVVLVFLSFASALISLGFGSADLSWQQIGQCFVAECQSNLHEMLLWQIRFPRVLVGFVAGMGLAVAGGILQNCTRNPLADPYLFGIVAGAGLGATIATLVLPDRLNLAVPLAAFLGALFAILLVIAVNSIHSRYNPEYLLLAGVAVSFMLGAFTNFLLYVGEPFASNRVMFWLMGSLARVNMQSFVSITPVVLIGITIILAMRRQLDALLISDESALSLGVNVVKVRISVLIICAALSATIVAHCGGIGFVGLMIPHIVRSLFGMTTSKLIVASALLGGCFLVSVDTLARSAIPDQEIPIGVITSAIGGCFFLILMHKRNSV